MQNKMGQLLTNLGLRVLEKSREYYYPPSMSRMAADNVELSEAEFTKLIRDIDRFSAQFSNARDPKKMGPENPAPIIHQPFEQA